MQGLNVTIKAIGILVLSLALSLPISSSYAQQRLPGTDGTIPGEGLMDVMQRHGDVNRVQAKAMGDVMETPSSSLALSCYEKSLLNASRLGKMFSDLPPPTICYPDTTGNLEGCLTPLDDGSGNPRGCRGIHNDPGPNFNDTSGNTYSGPGPCLVTTPYHIMPPTTEDVFGGLARNDPTERQQRVGGLIYQADRWPVFRVPPNYDLATRNPGGRPGLLDGWFNTLHYNWQNPVSYVHIYNPFAGLGVSRGTKDGSPSQHMMYHTMTVAASMANTSMKSQTGQVVVPGFDTGRTQDGQNNYRGSLTEKLGMQSFDNDGLDTTGAAIRGSTMGFVQHTDPATWAFFNRVTSILDPDTPGSMVNELYRAMDQAQEQLYVNIQQTGDMRAIFRAGQGIDRFNDLINQVWHWKGQIYNELNNPGGIAETFYQITNPAAGVGLYDDNWTSMSDLTPAQVDSGSAAANPNECNNMDTVWNGRPATGSNPPIPGMKLDGTKPTRAGSFTDTLVGIPGGSPGQTAIINSKGAQDIRRKALNDMRTLMYRPNSPANPNGLATWRAAPPVATLPPVGAPIQDVLNMMP